MIYKNGSNQVISRNQNLVVSGMFLAAICGLVISDPSLTYSIGTYNEDNTYIFTLPLMVKLSYDLTNGVFNKSSKISFVFMVLISPMTGILFMAAWLIVTDMDRLKSLKFFTALFIASILVLLLPKAIAHFYSFQDTASSIIFRTGLDGKTDEFTNLFSAVIFPIYRRPEIYLLQTIIITLTIFFFSTKFRIEIRWLIFLSIATSNYVIHLIVFPQSVAIHPYLYDPLVQIPLLIFFAHTVLSISKNHVTAISLIVVCMLLTLNLEIWSQLKECYFCPYEQL
jgi:hypothetical protein